MDGKVLVAVDIAEITHNPMPAGTTAYMAMVDVVTHLLSSRTNSQDGNGAGGHRADFEREREGDGSCLKCSRRPAAEGGEGNDGGWRANSRRRGRGVVALRRGPLRAVFFILLIAAGGAAVLRDLQDHLLRVRGDLDLYVLPLAPRY